jgi:hypothetical protein
VKRLVEFRTNSGDVVVVEVDELVLDESDRVSKTWERVVEATETFEQAIAKVKPIAESIITELRNLSEAPSEVSVKFGIKMSASAGAIVAAAGVEANYEVSLTWKSSDRHAKEKEG